MPVTRKTPAVISNPVNRAKPAEGKLAIKHSDVALGKQLGKGRCLLIQVNKKHLQK